MANDFTQQRIVHLITRLDQCVDEATRIDVMEGCGRMCARAGAIRAAQKAEGDLAALLQTLQRWIGADNVSLADHTVKIIYTKCFCEMAHAIDGLSPTYCYCSQGWLKEMFENVVAHPVDVRIHETIKRGNQICHFTVTL